MVFKSYLDLKSHDLNFFNLILLNFLIIGYFPSCGSELRKRYTLRLLLMYQRECFGSFSVWIASK